MPSLPDELLSKYGHAVSFALRQPCALRATVNGQGWAFDSDGILYVGPDGAAWIFLTPPVVPPDAARDLTRHPDVPPVRIRGHLEDGRRFEANHCLLENTTIHGGTGDILAGPGGTGITVQLHQPATTSYLLLVGGALVIQSAVPEAGRQYRIKYTLLNAVFDGLDRTERTVEGVTHTRLDRFSWISVGRTWTAQWLPSYDNKLKTALTSGSVRVAPTASVEVAGVIFAEIEQVDEAIDSACWLLGAASGCMVAPPVRQAWDGDVLIEERVEPRSAYTSARSNSSHELISNYEPNGGLKAFLESAHAAFAANRGPLALPQYLGWLNEARSQPVIQMRVVTVVLAIELMSFKWVTTHGLTEDQAAEMNIEAKLNRMRKDGMHFIDKAFTARDLRSGIRNPLMHTGMIPVMSVEELIRWSDSLYDLAFRIVLYVLGYKGKYRNLTNRYQLADAP